MGTVLGWVRSEWSLENEYGCFGEYVYIYIYYRDMMVEHIVQWSNMQRSDTVSKNKNTWCKNAQSETT